MITIILCAGFGTRMYPLTRNQPKALLPVAGRPVIDYLIHQLARFPGLEAVHVVSNDLFHSQFERWSSRAGSYLGDYGIELHLHNDGVGRNENRLGANGDLAFVLKRIEVPSGALIAAGDNIVRFDLLPIWESFRESQTNTVIATDESDMDKLRRTGVLLLDGADRVVGFREKPAKPPSRWSCPPFYFLNREGLEQVLQFVTQPNPPDAMGYVVHYLFERVPVQAFKVRGERLDIGVPETYREANELLKQDPGADREIS